MANGTDEIVMTSENVPVEEEAREDLGVSKCSRIPARSVDVTQIP